MRRVAAVCLGFGLILGFGVGFMFGRGISAEGRVPEKAVGAEQASGPWCGTARLMEQKAFDARMDLTQQSLREAAIWCDVILSPDSSEAEKMDARRRLAFVLADLKELTDALGEHREK